MDRVSMCNTIGNEFKTSNIEGGEYSYVQAAGSKEKLVRALGYEPKHFKLDIRFEHNDTVILVEQSKTLLMQMKISFVNTLRKKELFIPAKK